MSRSFIVAVLASLAVPAAGQAQEQTEPPQQVQEWLQELQQIQTRIEPVQQQALQDSAISAEQRRTMGLVRAAIVERDPEMNGVLTRFEQILAEAKTAQESGDAEKIAALTREAQELQPRIEAAHETALNQPEVASQVNRFQQQLRAKMIEIDPEMEPLFERVADLEKRIAAVMG